MTRARLSSALAAESLVILVACTYGAMMLVTLPAQVSGDTWLALLAGRVVAESGLPDVNTLTVWAHGVDWVDQQWLGQLGFYELAKAGGLKLALLGHAVVASAAVSLALAAARWRGGSQRMVARIGLLAFVPTILVMANARAQTFGYLLFVCVLWVLLADIRTPSWRVLWVVPPLVLWANVHGSVMLGAALTGLFGVVALVGGLRSPGGQKRAAIGHGAALIAIAVLTPLASPYGLSLVSYYQDTLGNNDFGQFITEWAPARPSLATAPFYALAALTLWLLGRGGRHLLWVEKLLLVGMLAAGMFAIRNIVWFCLTAIVLLPFVAESSARTQDATDTVSPRFTRGLSIGALIAVAVLLVVAAARPVSTYEESFPPRAADLVWRAASRDASSPIYADETYGDWLMWRHPSLVGRVLFDARFELISSDQFHDIIIFKQRLGPDWRRPAEGSRILVLNPKIRPKSTGISAADDIGDDPGTRLLFKARRLVVLDRRP